MALSDDRVLGGFWRFQTFQTVGTFGTAWLRQVLCTLRAAGLSLWAPASGPDGSGMRGRIQMMCCCCIFLHIPQAPQAPTLQVVRALDRSTLQVVCLLSSLPAEAHSRLWLGSQSVVRALALGESEQRLNRV